MLDYPKLETHYERRQRVYEWTRCYGGGSSGGGDSAYSRQGTGVRETSRTVPQYISDLITQNVNGSAPDPTLVAKQNATFTNIMDKQDTSIPGYSNFMSVANQSATDYPGRSTLATSAARDPFSSTFENATVDSFKQRAADAMAQVATGPDAVRGGASRTGIAQGVLAQRLAQERGYEVRGAQQQDAAMQSDAIKTMNNVELAKTGQSVNAASTLAGLSGGLDMLKLQAGKAIDVSKLNNMGLLQLAAGLQGTEKSVQTDDFTGQGNQSSSEMHGGISCCFIFLEALNGELPWYIDRARREYRTGSRRTGYVWMSEWLVPIMQRSARCKRFVNWGLIRPFLKYGACLYKDKTARITGWLYAPYCHAWLNLWGLLGKFVKASK